jgi:hypothetical protein
MPLVHTGKTQLFIVNATMRSYVHFTKILGKPPENLFPAIQLDAHMAHALNKQSFTFDLTSRFRAMITAIKSARAHRAAFNSAYTELQQLSDQELMEFGLHRSDLVDMARVEVYRD